MADLEELRAQLETFEKAQDFDGLRKIREQIVSEHAQAPEAVEARYKLGLDALFLGRDLPSAVDYFLEAAQSKHPFWSAAARTSLGLCYFHQGKAQKALFELRRVAYPEQPSPHSVIALAFIEQVYATDENLKEVDRVRKERIQQLRDLVADQKKSGLDAQEIGHHQYLLGLALQDSGEREEAYEVLTEAKERGPDDLGAELFQAVVEALEE